jgi:hypothetical protein
MAEDKPQDTTENKAVEHTPKRAPNIQRDVVFYYNRERRLEKAPPKVRELYEPIKRQGLFKTLTATKPRAMLFASIVLLVVVSLLFSFIIPNGTVSLGGNTITASAQVFQGDTYIVVKKRIPAGQDMNAYTGAVDLAVTIPVRSGTVAAPDTPAPPVSTERIFFTLQQEEDFRVSVPFTAAELLLILQAEDKQMTLRLRPE